VRVGKVGVSVLIAYKQHAAFGLVAAVKGGDGYTASAIGVMAWILRCPSLFLPLGLHIRLILILVVIVMATTNDDDD
jgi:hypothetical protein